MQPAGETTIIYNVNAIHDAKHVLHVTEGEFDAMILQQIGLPAVAFPGAKSFKGHHGRMLAGFNRLWVWGDPDAAGAEFVTKVTNRLPRSARGVKLTHGDVTDTFLAGGAKALVSLIDGELK
jgi:DNA primase